MELGRIQVPQPAVIEACEDRSAQRFTLLIRAAKLVAKSGEYLVVIRDVSETGISLRGFHALPAGDPLFLELQTGERYPLEPVWGRGNEGGFRFVGAVDVVRLIAEAGRYPKRKLRLNLALPVNLALLGRKIPVEIRNLSQQGARVECSERLAIAQPLRIVSDTLPEVRARVRWRKGDDYGLVFDDTFTLSELALFAARAQDPGLLVEPDCAMRMRP